MQILPYMPDPQTTAELIDLILFCQNTEAHLGITMAEHPDVLMIQDYYQARGGQFWVATQDGHVAGCIALLPVDHDTTVLKKFFTYPQFRGGAVHLGWQLYQTLLTYAQAQPFKRLVLDTPEAEHRSHQFYERQGFKQITFDQLGVTYAFSDRHSRFYALNLA
jgi:N-acetylglutamate synthase-like GNAT family acetyltransferase